MDASKDVQLIEFFQKHRVASLAELKTILGAGARMTVFRALCRLEYLSSYSHRGQFYTLWQIPEFDELGLWSFRSVRFVVVHQSAEKTKLPRSLAPRGRSLLGLDSALGNSASKFVHRKPECRLPSQNAHKGLGG
jgi:hypothetical protein